MSVFYKGEALPDLSKILGSLWGIKSKEKTPHTTRQLIASKRAAQVGGELYGVSLPIVNFKF